MLEGIDPILSDDGRLKVMGRMEQTGQQVDTRRRRAGAGALTGRGEPGLHAWLLIAALGLAVGCAPEARLVEPDEPRAPVEVRAAVDRAVATTGDLITYRVTVEYATDFEVDVPEAGAEIAGFRIVELGRDKPVEKRDRIIDERWYQLRADLVGSYVLPPVEVRYRPRAAAGEEPADWQVLSTSEIFVEVESVLPLDGEAEDIRGIKPLRTIQRPAPWLWIVLGLAAAAVLGVVVWLYWRYRSRRREQVPRVPPHELAFAALEALRGVDFNDPVAVRRFYFQLSAAVRAYVEGRFGLNATDLTTEEIVRGLPQLTDLDAEQNAVLKSFLMDTDQVKFAHHAPSEGEIESAYERALSFVETTQLVPENETEGVAA